MKTINRTPYTVNTPTSKEIGNKFFNHANWKGMCEDRNFVGIDQETFADCNNVYIDAEAVLKSRPSIKYSDISTYAKEGVTDLTDKARIYKVYTFGEYVIFYGHNTTDGNTLTFYKIVSDSLETQVYLILGNYTLTSIVQADNKIFAFTDLPGGNGKYYYFDTITDTLETELSEVEKYFYLPITKISLNGSIGSDAESPNELYSGYREQYDWVDDGQGTFTVGQFVSSYLLNSTESANKNTSLKIGDETYSTTITENTKNILVQQLSGTFDENEIKKTCVVKGNVIVYSFSKFREITSEMKKYDTYVVVSTDYGKSFNVLPSLAAFRETPVSNALTNLNVSEDGLLIYGLYVSTNVNNPDLVVISIAPDESGTFRYTTWTDLFKDKSLKTDSNATDFNGIAAAHVTSHDNFAWVIPSVTGTYAISVTYHLYRNNEHTQKKYTLNQYVVSSITPSVIIPKMIHLGTVIHIFYNYYYRKIDDIANTSVCGFMAVDLSLDTEQNIILNDLLPETANYLSMYVYGSDVYTVLKLNNTGISRLYYIKNYSHEELVSSEIFASTYIVAYGVFSILTASKLYNGDSQNLLHSDVYPLSVSPLVYYKNGKLYSSALVDRVTITDTFSGKIQNYDFEYEAELSNYYFAKDNKLMISATGAYQTKDFEWYMPKRNTEYFDYAITNLHPISATELAIFFQDSIYYTYYDSNVNAHRYNKTRIPLGLYKGSDVITTFDNKYTVFTTKRGMVAMAYQDFVNSTEQALTYLSDNIFDKFNSWNIGAVKLYQYKFWLICFKQDSLDGFVYDTRNGSWWPVNYKGNLLRQIIEINYKLYLLINSDYTNLYGTLYRLDKTSNKYYDGESGLNQISWFIRSQKLHFSAINYYKHINNITLSSVNDNPEESTFILRVINYRKEPTIGKNVEQVNRGDSTIQVKVSMIRTFAKRLHYFKVNEFEYTLSSFVPENGLKVTTLKPLSLTNITIRYTLTGMVR